MRKTRASQRQSLFSRPSPCRANDPHRAHAALGRLTPSSPLGRRNGQDVRTPRQRRCSGARCGPIIRELRGRRVEVTHAG
jgi:hypothetical protein